MPLARHASKQKALGFNEVEGLSAMLFYGAGVLRFSLQRRPKNSWRTEGQPQDTAPMSTIDQRVAPKLSQPTNTSPSISVAAHQHRRLN